MRTKREKVAIGITRSAKDFNKAYSITLEAILKEGHEVQAVESLSIGSKKIYKEILNYNVIVDNPQNRLIWHPEYRFQILGAIARFVWIMAANNRLEDISFYWGSRVQYFSDDGVVVPGSNYGERLLNPRPGVNQIEGIIDQLRHDHTTRRAAVTIYHPEDATRKSKDIPCPLGMLFHIREGRLHTSLVMRSNNAFILMPYNFFEFTLLAEIIAAELQIPLGKLSYFASSMHVYADNYTQAEKIANNVYKYPHEGFPHMPTDPSPMEQVKKLVKLEAMARHSAIGYLNEDFEELLNRSEAELHPYWRQFFLLLLLYIAQKRSSQNAINSLNKIIEPFWKDYILFINRAN